MCCFSIAFLYTGPPGQGIKLLEIGCVWRGKQVYSCGSEVSPYQLDRLEVQAVVKARWQHD